MTGANDAPTVQDDTAATAEDTAVVVAVLANDSDPDSDTLTVALRDAPLHGRVTTRADKTLAYTPARDFNGKDIFTYAASDGRLAREATVIVTVNAVNDQPMFPAPSTTRTITEDAPAASPVGAPVTAADVDREALTYGLFEIDAPYFTIDPRTGQIRVGPNTVLDRQTQPRYRLRVQATDPHRARVSTAVTVTVTAKGTTGPGPGGGGGGGGGGGPSPSVVDFEWNVKRDIEELDGGNDRATGVWSDGTTLWVADNADGAGDAVYAYDRETGERVEEREFALHETNRAPRGFWSDGETVWVSDSGRERLFAYRLADGERLEEREFELPRENRDARGIWSDEETMWVLDGRADALFAYDFESGELLAEYALDSANSDPRGIWSDGVTVWVSDHGAKRLFAYRPPAPEGPAAEDADDDRELERVRDEEFSKLSRASNNSPRGLWSDGDVMYVADESDDKVYSYNMPDAIDARLASLTLSGVDIGEFDPGQTDYEAVVADGVTETTIEAGAMQPRTGRRHRPARCRRGGGRLPGCPAGPRRDHGHRHLGGRQPHEDLPRGARRGRAVGELSARRRQRRFLPRGLRGRKPRRSRGLCGEPARHGALRAGRR